MRKYNVISFPASINSANVLLLQFGGEKYLIKSSANKNSQEGFDSQSSHH
ncbi:MAG: hypothetical protein FWD82_06980 [Defluviitaleaceae bacterium]|nr:hypothetical protein [Defluviitaleaceae bacterium]